MRPEMEALDASLPHTLPVFPGLSITGRYVLTDRLPLQRGDGLKAIGLPGSRVAVMVGDVVGHGATATTAMSRLLAIVRGRLEDGSSAAEAVRAADRYAASSPAAAGATLAVAVVSLDTRAVEYAGAGHPPPIHSVAHTGQASPVPLPPSRPLGTGGVVASAAGHLYPGEVLVLHTDGLLTAAGGGVADGGHRLGRVLRDAVQQQAHSPDREQSRGDAICEALLREVPGPLGYVDDVSLLVVEATEPPSTFRTTRAGDSEGATLLCFDFERWVDALDAGMLDQIALRHAFAEITTNVVRHAYSALTHPADKRIHVEACLTDEGRLHVSVRDDGRWQARDDAGGRGLVLAGGLVDTMHLRRTATGTEVILEHQLGRTIPVLQSSNDLEPSRSGRPRANGVMTTTAAAGRLRVAGPLTEESVEEFRTSIHEVTRAGTSDATVELDDVTHLASAPLRVLLDYHDRTLTSGASIDLVASPGTIADQVLDLVDLPHRAE